MGSSKRSKSNRHRSQGPGSRSPYDRNAGAIPLAEADDGRVSPLVNLLSFAGYMASVWLIGQTVNSFPSQAGIVWSPALLGVVLALTTAIIRDERGLRSRLGIADFSSRRASVVWGALGVLGIFSIMTLPR